MTLAGRQIPETHGLRTRIMARFTALLVVGVLGAATLAARAETAPIDGRENLNAVLWMQTAHEYAFSTAQVYAMATRALPQARSFPSALVDEDAPVPGPDASPAIVLDLDETVLETSGYAAGLIAAGRRHSEQAWEDWVGKARGDPVPGALEFLRAASGQGYRIFYVTNRTCPDAGRPASYPHPACPQRDATMAQSRRLGLPAAEDPKSFLFRNDQDGWASGDKSLRRRFLAGSHRVVMLFGDDLGDFLPRAEVKALREPRAPDQHVGVATRPAPWQVRFGTQWFLLPNPSYGSWEIALSNALANCETPDSQACYEARRERKYGRLIPAGPTPAPAPTPTR